jgi:lysophospholipase L1-like esterase
MVFLYAGDNDIANGESPEKVASDFKAFVKKVHGALPQVRIGYIAIKPSIARERWLNEMKTTNRLIREYAESSENLLFIDVFTPMLDQSGKPRSELFIEDGLHLNPKGYALWASIIGPVLDRHDAITR